MSGPIRCLALAILVSALLGPARAEEVEVGPWYLTVEPNRAVAALDDPNRVWTLMVRCDEGHLDILVRRRAEPPTEQATIRHYAGSLQVDGGAPTSFPAQTWSQDGFLVLDAGPLLPGIEAGLELDFAFVDGAERTGVSFLAGHTQQALQPVRRRCEAPVS